MKRGYLLFHLNLAFSSIAESARPEVIQQCYWPILELIEKSNIPIGIELTGWTLQQINHLDPVWVNKFKTLLAQQRCELIGSGWSQLIGPLVPFQVNLWNQKLALALYQTLLNYRPTLVLVNEMAFASSLVELYQQVGYHGLIMDRDNIRLALKYEHHDMPTHACGVTTTKLPVLWSDSVLFQRLQRAVHGDIPIVQYLNFVQQRMASEELPLAIYANDAEVFNYRPGRFSTEGKTHPEGEWTRLQRILKQLQEQTGIEFISPTDALKLSKLQPENAMRLSSLNQPIPVKKQAKYNVNRWAAAGRDNIWLNTQCHSQYQQLSHDANSYQWQTLCELWASDFRTHITQERWLSCLQKLSTIDRVTSPSTVQTLASDTENKLELKIDDEAIYWHLATSQIKLTLNLRRGMSIDSLAFKSWQFKPLLVTKHQGYFDTIALAADFYSGGLIIEMPGLRRRITDLEWVNPELTDELNFHVITAKLDLAHFNLTKIIKISKTTEELRISYQLDPPVRNDAIIRLGIMTINMTELEQPATLEVWQGGALPEHFSLADECDHTHNVSTLVSSSASFGATTGQISIGDQHRAITLSWNPALCAAVPLLLNRRYKQQHLTRIFFSLSELDDTFKAGGHLLNFELAITPGSLSRAEESQIPSVMIQQ
ncbi:hypothetical protein JAO78_013105 [Alishewanella sp. 16-MA]|uniref:Glycoside hydrolase family 57 N-terminal domain-containing protein n=1 Tax=Alishewanella maricola TaxID=2795740 RepID=A0ABS8C736_9ALTE|nr:hypothetical protein [Alishewanella maricola]MCB5227750.1 hypothetical protein [Alishewanella maricola]